VPVLEPPGVWVRSTESGHGGAIAFGAVPRAASVEELARATRAAGEDSVEDVLRRARRHLH
jgi:hypothetical protein